MSRVDPSQLPSVDELNRIFEYDPISGLLTWKVDRFNRLRRCVARAGTEAGCMHHGYRLISIGGGCTTRSYYHAHRIAWKMFYGEEPPAQVDHIDRNRGNNSISNLRAASNSESAANRSTQNRNKSGFSGVRWLEGRKRWIAYVRNRHLGSFLSYDEAIAAREKAARETFGEFSPHTTKIS